MKYKEIALQFKQLPIDQQMMLLEELTRTLRDQLMSKAEQQKQKHHYYDVLCSKRLNRHLKIKNSKIHIRTI